MVLRYVFAISLLSLGCKARHNNESGSSSASDSSAQTKIIFQCKTAEAGLFTVRSANGLIGTGENDELTKMEVTKTADREHPGKLYIFRSPGKGFTLAVDPEYSSVLIPGSGDYGYPCKSKAIYDLDALNALVSNPSEPAKVIFQCKTAEAGLFTVRSANGLIGIGENDELKKMDICQTSDREHSGRIYIFKNPGTTGVGKNHFTLVVGSEHSSVFPPDPSSAPDDYGFPCTSKAVVDLATLNSLAKACQ